MTHPDLTLRGIADKNAPAALAEIDNGIKADEKAADNPAPSSTPIRTARFFRYPGFADTKALNDVLAERGIAIFGADLWASDWNRMTWQKELELLKSRLEASKHRGIILLHDTKAQTAQMLPHFLRYLKENHYRVVAVVPRDGDGKADLVPAPEGWTSETEESLKKIMPRLLAGSQKTGHKSTCNTPSPHGEEAAKRPSRTTREPEHCADTQGM